MEILNTFRRKVRNRINPPAPPAPRTNTLFHWIIRDGRHNFGDHLSSAISTKMAAERGMFFDEIVDVPRRLLAIGSILHFAENGNVVWGSGINGSVPLEWHRFDMLDVRAVRGPLTKDFLEKRGIPVPSVFGDPALLTRKLIGSRFPAPERRSAVTYVPNLQDLELMEGWENVIDPRLPWARVIARIIASEHVISSSLHGLIIADTFGIPCTYLRLSDHENLFKYEDYCLGAGRSGLKVVQSRNEAITSTPMDPIRFDPQPLYDAYPWDMWD